ncbi:hypothetical protein MRB53_029709 [Persea americana]|uniref:Uncharacterized protein n=1 Tax=Persea americana TaxID=3435 RepID=A0ACC2KJ53_PERAE|nr:hypothetical protein MRB53_029709 [Persea americana]
MDIPLEGRLCIVLFMYCFPPSFGDESSLVIYSTTFPWRGMQCMHMSMTTEVSRGNKGREYLYRVCLEYIWGYHQTHTAGVAL